jgi:hypothetical protein
MNDVIKIGGFEIRENDQGWYCLNDLHRASGGEKRHYPNYFMELEQTKSLIYEMEVTGIPVTQTIKNVGTFVKKEIVYAFAMWISPRFYLEVIQTYDRIIQEEHAQLEELQAKLKTSIPKDPNCVSSVIGGSPLEAHKFFKKMEELELVRIEIDYKPVYKKFITDKGWDYCQGYSKDGIIRVEPEMHNALMALVAKTAISNQIDWTDT